VEAMTSWLRRSTRSMCRVGTASSSSQGSVSAKQPNNKAGAVRRRSLDVSKLGRVAAAEFWARPIGQHINPGELRSRWQRGVKLVEWYEIRQTVRRALRRNNLAAHERLSTRVGHRHRRADWENDGPGSALLASTDDMAILVWRRDRGRSGPT